MARTANEERIFRTAIERYGERSQMCMVLEEMSELAKEICKAFRNGKGNRKNKIAEECADVEITLEQLKMMLKIDDDVAGWRLDKTVRLAERLEIIPDYRAD